MSKTTINDMTIGSPAKLIIKFMIPMCLGNLFQQFYNVVDSIVAGQFLGVQALAAIGSTGSLMFFVIGWLNGLTSGFAIMVAQSFGAKQYDRMRHYVAMSIYLSVAFALVMTIGFSVANEQILRLMNYSDEIMPSVKGYMGIIYMGLLVTVAYDALSAFLRALGDSRSPLYFLMISAGINVVLDIVLIVVMGMGVEGCAYATVIAQAISALLCFIYICKKFPILRLKKTDFQIALKSLGKLLGLGIPMALQFSITAIGTIIVQGAINIYGENCMAGFSAAGKLQNIFMTVFVAFGATIATYVGQNRGAGKMDRVKQGVRCTQYMIWGWSVVNMIAMFFFGKYISFFCGCPCSKFVSAGFDRFALCCAADITSICFHTIVFTSRFCFCDRPVMICFGDRFPTCKFLTACDTVSVSCIAFFLACSLFFISDLCLCMSCWCYRLFFSLFARLTCVFFDTI